MTLFFYKAGGATGLSGNDVIFAIWGTPTGMTIIIKQSINNILTNLRYVNNNNSIYLIPRPPLYKCCTNMS